MKAVARIQGDMAIEVVNIPDDLTIEDMFHPDIAAQFVPVPYGIASGATRHEGEWTNPVHIPPQPPAPEPAAPNKRMTKLAFLQRFTLDERMAFHAATGTDPIAADFLMMVNAASFIDLERDDTESGVGYLVSKGIITTARAKAILTDEVLQAERPLVQ